MKDGNVGTNTDEVVLPQLTLVLWIWETLFSSQVSLGDDFVSENISLIQ